MGLKYTSAENKTLPNDVEIFEEAVGISVTTVVKDSILVMKSDLVRSSCENGKIEHAPVSALGFGEMEVDVS
jgi:hypothetical protein